MVTYSFGKFPISLTLINCQRCLNAESEEIFTIVSRFSNHISTNHTCARNAISTLQLFTLSVYRLRMIMTPTVLDFIILIKIECDYKL